MSRKYYIHVIDCARLAGVGQLEVALLYLITIHYFQVSVKLTERPVVLVTPLD